MGKKDGYIGHYSAMGGDGCHNGGGKSHKGRMMNAAMKTFFTFTIRNFSSRREKAGDFVASQEFFSGVAHLHTWKLNVYPCGNREDLDAVTTSLTLVDSEQRSIQRQFEIGILDYRGEKFLPKKSSRKFSPEAENTWGYFPFTNRSFLFSNCCSILPNDTLTFYCEISSERKETIAANKYLVSTVETQTLAKDLETLYKSREFSDFFFVVAGKDIPVHKAILAARSNVFKELISRALSDGRTRVHLYDLQYDVFIELLGFIYTEKVPSLEGKLPLQLLAAATKYDIKKLKSICERQVKVHVENAVEILIFANRQSSEGLKKQTLDFISKNADLVKNTMGWKELRLYPHLMEDINDALIAEMTARKK